jgi:hypothetical protein
MTMRITAALLTAILYFQSSAFGQFTIVELAHEIPLTEFTVPVTRNGTLNFRQCSDCKQFSARMTPQTRFIVNDQDVDLKEFRERVLALGRSEEHVLTILQHVEKNTVTFISISI